MKHVQENLFQFKEASFFHLFEEEEQEVKEIAQEQEEVGTSVIDKAKENFNRFEKDAKGIVMRYKEFWEENETMKTQFGEGAKTYKMFDSTYVLGLMDLPDEALQPEVIDQEMDNAEESDADKDAEEVFGEEDDEEDNEEDTDKVNESDDKKIELRSMIHFENIKCPKCNEKSKFAIHRTKKEHTQLFKCPKCEKQFQAKINEAEKTYEAEKTQPIDDQLGFEEPNLGGNEEPNLGGNQPDPLKKTIPVEEHPIEDAEEEVLDTPGQPKKCLVVYNMNGENREEIFRSSSNSVMHAFEDFYENTFKGAMKAIIAKAREKQEQIKKEMEVKAKAKEIEVKKTKVDQFLKGK